MQCIGVKLSGLIDPKDIESFRKTPEFKKSINELAKKSFDSDPETAAQSREMLNKLLILDQRNSSYFFRMLKKAFAWTPSRGSSTSRRVGLWIEESGKTPPPGSTVFRPFTKSFSSKSQMLWYDSFLSHAPRLLEVAKGLTVEFAPMDGGKGSSVSRASHQERFARGAEDRNEGSKSTDLYDFKLGVSLAEIRVLQAFAFAKEKVFKRLVVDSLVGPETVHSAERNWKRECFLDPSKTYEQYAQTLGNVERGETVVQSYNPSIDGHNQLSFERTNPYGHGFFAQFGLERSFKFREGPRDSLSKRLLVIFNGEDEGGMPDPIAMAGVYESGSPITLFATEKVPGVDKKGGVVGEKDPGSSRSSVTVVDTAQAEESGQGEHFRNGQGIVSTNELVFNEDALDREIWMGIQDQGKKAYVASLRRDEHPNFNDPAIKKRIFELGWEVLTEKATPDFIANAKKQNGEEFIQPEGTISTAVFNLSRFWVETYGRPLVQVLGFSKENRTLIHLPIKFAIDHVEKSLRFKRDPKTFRLIDPTPGHRPIFDLSGGAGFEKFYEDVETAWHAFEGSDMIHLATLKVVGKVLLRSALLQGDVTVTNLTEIQVDVVPRLKNAQGDFTRTHGGQLPSSTHVQVRADGSIHIDLS